MLLHRLPAAMTGARLRQWLAALLFLSVFLLYAACPMNVLPRNMGLKAFDPHRKEFVCRHEADVVPPIDAEAERWFQQAMALTSRLLWPNQRDYPQAVALWTQAAQKKHWKAMLNLANAYAQGEGVTRDTERAVRIVEEAMRLGIPAAYDLMGTYHMEGLGVNQDASRAYAFWQLAADMGSPSAMAYLGEKMRAVYADPQAGIWANRKIALKMLECGFSQGNGNAAYELGVTLVGTDKSLDEDNARSLRVLHEGVKFGSKECAGYLGGAFSAGEPPTDGLRDPSRARRYYDLSEALWRDPDLRLPNLDKVLPLPPAELPKWDGKRQTLIDAAKAVVPAAPASAPASQRSDHSPAASGHALSEPTARLVNALAARGIAREASLPQPVLLCPGGRLCPATGVWQAVVDRRHPHAAVFNQWHRQSYVEQGQSFTDPRNLHLAIEPPQVTWRWWGQANEVRAGDIVHIRVEGKAGPDPGAPSAD